MRKIWLGFIGLLFGVAAVVPLALSADAAVTNCSKGTGGTYAWSFCSSTTGNPPYTTQHVITVLCKEPGWLGGDSYVASGNWANVGNSSRLYCAPHYNATQPIILFR